MALGRISVNGKTYGFNVEPSYGKVVAEVYKIIELDRKTELHLASKKFGRIFRKIRKKDYEDARKWAENQLNLICHANK